MSTMKPETDAQRALRIVRNWIEREARTYAGSRSRAAARERLKLLHGWKAKLAAVRSEVRAVKTTLPTPVAQFEPLPARHSAATPTPPPWRITVCEVTGAIWIERRTGGTKEAVCKMRPNLNTGRDLANAELILAALNSHDRLTKALESSLRVFQGWLHDVDPYNELGNDNPNRAAAVNMIELCSAALSKP